MSEEDPGDDIDDVMEDTEFMALMGELSMHCRRKVVAHLLAGNDTQCFTTQQYREAYDKVLYPKSPNPLGLLMVEDKKYGYTLARKHLLSVRLVEVAPDVWAKR